MLTAALLAGCDRSVPTLPPLPADAVILAFGDSLTRGTGAPPEAAYPAVLSRLTGRRVINAGVPGELSDAGAERLPGVLDRHTPHLLVLCHGGNDLLRRRPMARVQANLARMIEAARERGVPVVLIGVPAPKLFGLEAAPMYAQLAARYDLPYEADALPVIESDASLKADRIHPNAAGYARLAAAVHDLLRAAGAL